MFALTACHSSHFPRQSNADWEERKVNQKAVDSCCFYLTDVFCGRWAGWVVLMIRPMQPIILSWCSSRIQSSLSPLGKKRWQSLWRIPQYKLPSVFSVCHCFSKCWCILAEKLAYGIQARTRISSGNAFNSLKSHLSVFINVISLAMQLLPLQFLGGKMQGLWPANGEQGQDSESLGRDFRRSLWELSTRISLKCSGSQTPTYLYLLWKAHPGVVTSVFLLEEKQNILKQRFNTQKISLLLMEVPASL